MEAATQTQEPKVDRLDESTAVTLWQRLTQIDGIGKVNLWSGVGDVLSLDERGVAEGERWYEVSLYGNIDAGTLERIQSIARELGRRPQIRGSVLVIR